MKTLVNKSVSELKEKYKIQNCEFESVSHPGRKAKGVDIVLPTGIPFLKVSPAEALKRLEQNKERKLLKGSVTDESPIGKMYNRNCKNPNCKRKFSTNNSMKVYCRPECRESFIVYGKDYF